VEFAICLQRVLVVFGKCCHLREQLLEQRDMFITSALRGLSGNLGLDQQARLNHFEGCKVPFWQTATLSTLLGLADIDATAHANLNQTGHLQRDQRFAHRWTGDAEFFGKIALGRQARVHRKLARLNQVAKLIGDLLIDTARVD